MNRLLLCTWRSETRAAFPTQPLTHDPLCFRGSEGPLNDDDDDSDIEMESTNEVVLPHLRMHCTQFAMPPLNQQVRHV